MYDEFTCNIVFRQGHYQVALPWKEFHDVLPDHYQLSHNRLRGLLRRLRHDPATLEQYDCTIKGTIREGHH